MIHQRDKLVIYYDQKLVHELEIESFDFEDEIRQITNLFSDSTKRIDIILPETWPSKFYEKVVQITGEIVIHVNNKPLSVLKELFN